MNCGPLTVEGFQTWNRCRSEGPRVGQQSVTFPVLPLPFQAGFQPFLMRELALVCFLVFVEEDEILGGQRAQQANGGGVFHRHLGYVRLVCNRTPCGLLSSGFAHTALVLAVGREGGQPANR